MRRQIKLFGSNLVIAAAYFSGGILGMMLAFAPSNASPIWPASGIALGGLLICGKKILPGLFIGALATQIYAFADTSSLPKIIDSIWIGSVIGIASCLQATVGAKLIHRFVGKDNPLIEDRKILYFFLLGGPLSSTISATIGISTLYLKGIISVNDYAISWGTWWVGDSIGVLVVTPLILCYFAQPKKQWKKRRKNFPLPLFTLLALVLLVFYYSHQKEKVRIEAAFERQVFLLHKTLNDEVHHHFETSQILKGLFDSLPDITEEQFKIFATPIIQRRATIQALEWIPKVASHEKIQFEKENGIDIRERGEHNRMIGVLQRDEYFPILYLYPYETNEKALGYDIGSNPSASKALQTARDSGKTVSSEKLWLIQDKVRKAGIILYTPVYDTPDPGNSVEQRRKSFKGVIALVFRIESEMLEALSHLTDFQLLTEIRDGKSVLYSDFPKKVPHKFDNFSLQKNLSINVGDRLWLLTFKPSDLFVHDHTSWTIWWILLGGLLFTGMMGMGLLVLTGRTAYVEKLVDIKTDDLREANQRLNKEIKLRLDLEDEQNFRYKILEMLSSELPLEKILLHIVIGAEKTRPGTICVIMLLDEQGKFFRHSVAPSLPDFYNRAMDGLAVGPGIGSCGTAAFTGSRVIVEDIRNHPYWEDYQSLLTRTQLHACWSEPIFSSKNKVLGTFAIYYKEKRSPARRDLDFIYRMGQLAGIVIEHKRDEEELRIAATTFESHEAIMITAADGSILRVNRSFSKITGYSEEEAIGQNPKILASGQHKVEFFQNMYRILEHKSQWRGEIWNKRKNGEIYPERLTITAVKNESGKVSHYVAIFSDITEKKKAEREIRNLAFYDSLTGLPNRRLLLNRLEQELVSARRHQLFGSLIYLDLDRFKVINDSLGHHIGDQLLIQVAKRIKNAIREEDTPCRLGGDEFVILRPSRETSIELATNHAAIIAEKLKNAINQPYLLEESEYLCSTSIGVTIFPEAAKHPLAIMQQADTAMYRSKEEGRNNIRFFRPSMQEAADKRLLMEKELRTAIREKQFQLYFQPQVDQSGHITSAEALIRWPHPTKGMISPAEFIPVSEDTHLILPIGDWVLGNACSNLKSWEKQGIQIDHIAVNVSSKQFRQEAFVEQVKHAVEKAGILPGKLMIELTEGVLVENIEDTVTKMLALKKLGISISIDDFGTGYSSLSYLKKLPLSQLKIDQSFVRDIATDPNDATIVETIVEMAKNLGLDVIAEGVENEDQLIFLKSKGCKKFQGYYFGKPVPGEEFCSQVKSCTAEVAGCLHQNQT